MDRQRHHSGRELVRPARHAGHLERVQQQRGGPRCHAAVAREKVGNDWQVTGIGTSRTIAATGAQSFDFGLVEGSADTAGRFFGWKDGTAAGVNNAGAIEYTNGTSQRVTQYGFQGALSVGTVPSGSMNVLQRSYSVQASVKPGPVQYDVGFSSMATLDVVLGAGADGLSLRNRPGTEVTTVTLDSGAGNDVIVLADLAANTVVHLGDGQDEAQLGSLRPSTSVTVYGEAGEDLIQISQAAAGSSTTVFGGLDADTIRVAGFAVSISAVTTLHGNDPGTDPANDPDTAPYDVLQYNPAGLVVDPSAPGQSSGTLRAGVNQVISFVPLQFQFAPLVGTVAYDTFESVQVIAAPVVTLTSPAAIREGESLHLQASVSPLGSTNSLAEPLAWDIDGDGRFGEVVGTDITLSWSQLRDLGINDDGSYRVSARAVNGDGFVTIASTTVTIDNLPPTIALAGGSTVAPSVPFVISFSASDPGDDRVLAWEVDWGDGSGSQQLGSNTSGAQHTFSEPGDYSIVVTATDEDTSVSAAKVVQVRVAQAQVSAGGPYTIAEGDSLTLAADVVGTPLQILWDINGDYFVDGTSPNGSSTLTLSWDQLQNLLGPKINDNGVFQVLLRADYANGDQVLSPTTTLTVTNAAPVAGAQSTGPVSEGGDAVVRFTGVSDPSAADMAAGFSYSVSLVTPFGSYQNTVQSTGAPVDMAIPAALIADAGSYTVLARITDKDGGFSEQSVTVTVLESAPQLAVTGASSAQEGEDFVLGFGAANTGVDPVTQWIIDWGDGSVDTFDGSATVASHRFVDDGVFDVTVTARDKDGSYSAARQVLVTNVAASLLDLLAGNGDEGGVVGLSGRIVDPGLRDSFTLDIDWGDGQTQSIAFEAGATSFSIGHIYGDDNPSGTAADTYSISATLRDDDAGSVSSGVQTIVANLAPALEIGLDATAVVEGDLAQVSGNIADAGASDTHVVTIDWGDGSSSLAVVDQVTHTFSASHRYPDDNPGGTASDAYTITASVTDDDGGQAQVQTQVTITNADPLVNGLALGEVNDAGTSSVTLSGSLADIGLPDTHTVTVQWGDGSSSDAVVDAHTRTFVAHHVFAIDLVPGYRIQVLAQDDDGGVSAPVTIDTSGYLANRAPVAAPYTVTLNEGEAVTLDLLRDSTDADGDPLQVFMLNSPQHGSLRSLGNGQVRYEPAALYNGTDSFRYRLSDGLLGSNVATVQFEVLPTNSAPTALDDGFAGEEDSAIVGNVVANDSDGDGDLLTASLVDGPLHGSLLLDPDGSFRYLPSDDFHGTDSFRYVARDGRADSTAATVTLTVRPVNDAPVARDIVYALDEDSALFVAAIGVLSNDSDVDGDPLTASLVDGAAHGSLQLNADGSFLYTPDANFHGTDSFRYRVNDGSTDSAVATVGLMVRPLNDAPTLAQIADLQIDEGQSLQLAMQALDADGDALAFSLLAAPLGASIDALGVVRWHSDDGDAQHLFTVRVSDASGAGAERSFSVAVANVPPDLGLMGPAQAVQGQAYTVQLGHQDPGADTLTEWLIDWGDGTHSVVAGNASQASHVYEQHLGATRIQLGAQDEDGLWSGPALDILVVANPLQVLSFSPGMQGFSVRFNQAFDPLQVNLYGAGQLPGDVLMRGAAVGAIEGSLLIDADSMGFSFLKTGLQLAPDQYSVTIKSGAGAFTSARGVLDGDADGAAGGDFVAQFGIDQVQGTTLRLPDFTRGPGQAVHVPAATLGGLPLTLNSSVGVHALSLEIRFDPGLLALAAVQRASGLPADAVLDVDLTQAGLARISITSATGLPPGTRPLLVLDASVPSGARYGATQRIAIGAVVIDGQARPDAGDDAMHVVGYLGDADASQSYERADVSLIQRVMFRTDTGFAAWDDVSPVVIADVDGNGVLSTTDAGRVNQVAAGLVRPEIPAIPSLLLRTATLGQTVPEGGVAGPGNCRLAGRGRRQLNRTGGGHTCLDVRAGQRTAHGPVQQWSARLPHRGTGGAERLAAELGCGFAQGICERLEDRGARMTQGLQG
jgi:hypothetical protein